VPTVLSAGVLAEIAASNRLAIMCLLSCYMPLNEINQERVIGITELTAGTKLGICFMWKLLTNKQNLILDITNCSKEAVRRIIGTMS